MKKLIIIIAVIVISAGLTYFFARSWYERQINLEASDSSETVEVEIESGESVKNIAVKLQTAGVIKSSDLFFLYVKLNNISPDIQAGRFQIPQNLTIKEVAQFIQKAAGNDIWITIPEGLRLDEIATILDEEFLKEENTIFEKSEFINICQNPDNYNLTSDILSLKKENTTLEGFLYPDTYNVKKNISSIELIELFLDTLDQKLEDNDINLTSYTDLTPYEIITLASIIEREAFTSEERYMISDILQKRLRGELDGVKLLQTDATLLYEEQNWETVVTKELKEKDTLYNTYKYTGLPPTPICNPGIDSIEAVMSPTQNEYFFYLHDDEGKIHYAVTNEEHVNNQRCYINKNQNYCL